MLSLDDKRWGEMKGGCRVPGFLKDGYQHAIRELAEIGLKDLDRADDREVTRSILGILALWKGARTYARILIEFSEDEILELEDQAFGT